MSQHGGCDVDADHGSPQVGETESDDPGSHADLQYRPITSGQPTVEFGGVVAAPLLPAPGGVVALGHIVVDSHRLRIPHPKRRRGERLCVEHQLSIG